MFNMAPAILILDLLLGACGTERSAVKTMTDAEKGAVRLTNATHSSVAELLGLAAPAYHDDNPAPTPRADLQNLLDAALRVGGETSAFDFK